MKYCRMISRAGHDSKKSYKIPTGMIFNPSIDGRIHCLEEFIEERILKME